MAPNKEPIFVGAIIGNIAEFTDTTEMVVFQGDGEEATRVDSLVATTDDTVDNDLVIVLHNGVSGGRAATVKIPLTSGQANAIAPVNLLAHAQLASHVCLDGAGNRFLDLPPGWSLRAAMAAAPTGGKKLWVFARGGKY